MERSLAEISLRARPALTCDFSAALINLARIKSPSTIFGLVMLICKAKAIAPADALVIAKAVRWLAVIRRDYGNAAFEEVVKDYAKPDSETDKINFS